MVRPKQGDWVVILRDALYPPSANYGTCRRVTEVKEVDGSLCVVFPEIAGVSKFHRIWIARYATDEEILLAKLTL